MIVYVPEGVPVGGGLTCAPPPPQANIIAVIIRAVAKIATRLRRLPVPSNASGSTKEAKRAFHTA